MAIYTRLIRLPKVGGEMFFLWGARQSGKSTWLRECYPGAKWLDLLKADTFRRYATNPEKLREELAHSRERFVVVDEVQKVPALLDEIHCLHENRGIQFALCGSSARKLRHGHGNLLGGRALRHELFGFCAAELGAEFDLVRMMNHGTLPRIYLSERPRPLLNAYVGEYLQQEVLAEGLVRNLPPFSEFLSSAALCDSEQVNYTSMGRELGVSRETVRGYFSVLVDTLLGAFLPIYRKRPKRRLSIADKFYFNDVGVVNFLAKRSGLVPGAELFGKAFENWLFHELRSYNAYRERFADFSFWRLSTGVEVDFIVNDLECGIEGKASSRVRVEHLKGLRELAKEHSRIKRRIVVSLEPTTRMTEDGITIFSLQDFLQALWAGELF